VTGFDEENLRNSIVDHEGLGSDRVDPASSVYQPVAGACVYRNDLTTEF
jgi:hypothetical protein